MKYLTFLAISISLLGCGRTAQSVIENALVPTGSASTNETATIEKVYSANEEGFSYVCYQVTWHGQQVIVSDPIHSTNFKVGDKISFMVMKLDLSKTGQSITKGTKTLAFQIF